MFLKLWQQLPPLEGLSSFLSTGNIILQYTGLPSSRALKNKPQYFYLENSLKLEISNTYIKIIDLYN